MSGDVTLSGVRLEAWALGVVTWALLTGRDPDLHTRRRLEALDQVKDDVCITPCVRGLLEEDQELRWTVEMAYRFIKVMV